MTHLQYQTIGCCGYNWFGKLLWALVPGAIIVKHLMPFHRLGRCHNNVNFGTHYSDTIEINQIWCSKHCPSSKSLNFKHNPIVIVPI